MAQPQAEGMFIPVQRRPRGSVILPRVPYNDEHDILIRRDERGSTEPEELWRVMWRVVSRVAVRSPLQPWPVALEHARAHAKRTGGGVYRQVGRATPERVEW